MDETLRIVEVELVEHDMVGVTLSDETAILVTLKEILSLKPAFFAVLCDDG